MKIACKHGMCGKICAALLCFCLLLSAAGCGSRAGKRLDLTPAAGADGAPVFAAKAADFAESYNSLCEDRGEKLPAVSGWTRTGMEETAHFGGPVTWLRCRIDDEVWTSPAFSAYTGADGRLRELTVDFDDHGMSDGLYQSYEQMSLRSLALFLPDVPEESRRALFDRMYAETDSLISETNFDDCTAPPVMYRSGEVGVYPYFAYGEFIRICFVPLTAERAQQLTAAGTQITDISELALN